MPASNRKRILIVGGGFAGVFTAMHLETQLRKPKLVDAVETVLVNRENYFVFQPMLPEVISGSRTGDVPDASEGAGSWCREGDLNPHGNPIRPSSVRVCQFRHPGRSVCGCGSAPT